MGIGCCDVVFGELGGDMSGYVVGCEEDFVVGVEYWDCVVDYFGLYE